MIESQHIERKLREEGHTVNIIPGYIATSRSTCVALHDPVQKNPTKHIRDEAVARLVGHLPSTHICKAT